MYIEVIGIYCLTLTHTHTNVRNYYIARKIPPTKMLIQIT